MLRSSAFWPNGAAPSARVFAPRCLLNPSSRRRSCPSLPLHLLQGWKRTFASNKLPNMHGVQTKGTGGGACASMKRGLLLRLRFRSYGRLFRGGRCRLLSATNQRQRVGCVERELAD